MFHDVLRGAIAKTVKTEEEGKTLIVITFIHHVDYIELACAHAIDAKF
jgi:hypothetical protein